MHFCFLAGPTGPPSAKADNMFVDVTSGRNQTKKKEKKTFLKRQKKKNSHWSPQNAAVWIFYMRIAQENPEPRDSIKPFLLKYLKSASLYLCNIFYKLELKTVLWFNVLATLKISNYYIFPFSLFFFNTWAEMYIHQIYLCANLIYFICFIWDNLPFIYDLYLAVQRINADDQ